MNLLPLDQPLSSPPLPPPAIRPCPSQGFPSQDQLEEETQTYDSSLLILNSKSGTIT